MENPNEPSFTIDAGNTIAESDDTSKPIGSGGNSEGNNVGDIGPRNPADETQPRKRGRPAGSGKNQRAANGIEGGATVDEKRPTPKKALDLSNLASSLEGVHAMAALVLKNPTVAISKLESEKLALALQNLSKHYNIAISPVLIAWVQLAGVSAAIYGPRIVLNIAASKANAAKQKVDESLRTAGTVSNAMSVSPKDDASINQSTNGVYKFQ